MAWSTALLKLIIQWKRHPSRSINRKRRGLQSGRGAWRHSPGSRSRAGWWRWLWPGCHSGTHDISGSWCFCPAPHKQSPWEDENIETWGAARPALELAALKMKRPLSACSTSHTHTHRLSRRRTPEINRTAWCGMESTTVTAGQNFPLSPLEQKII